MEWPCSIFQHTDYHSCLSHKQQQICNVQKKNNNHCCNISIKQNSQLKITQMEWPWSNLDTCIILVDSSYCQILPKQTFWKLATFLAFAYKRYIIFVPSQLSPMRGKNDLLIKPNSSSKKLTQSPKFNSTNL
jgi:hypothetical protein